MPRIWPLFLGALLYGETATPPITPAINGIFPHGLQRGTTTDIVIRGRNLQNTSALIFTSSKIRATILEATPYRVKAKIADDDPNVPEYAVRDLYLPLGVVRSRMEGRRSLINVVDSKIRDWDTPDTFSTLDSFYQSAFELMKSPAAKEAFDIAQEPEKLREKYGRTAIGQGALLARRLVEAGVRFITASRGDNTWDHHNNIFPLLSNDFLPELHKAFSSLIDDLYERGMLESTIVLVTGEFGRTPEINVNVGRDHWPNAFSLVIAGGGISGGRVWGSTDADGMYVKDSPVETPDFRATLFHKLGIDHSKEYRSNIGRPMANRWTS